MRNLISGLAAATAAVGACAQCDIYRLAIPDFDQKRADLPGIPGSGLPGQGTMWCVPTSASDLLAYISNNGYPAAFPGGPTLWQSPQRYQSVTGLLAQVGAEMGTTPEDGTTGGGFVSGLDSWFALAGLADEFVPSWIGPSGFDAPTPEDLYLAMLNGYLVTTCYGRYDFWPANVPVMGLPPRFVRSGGHCVAVSEVIDGCSASPTLGLRNPSSSDSRTVQSPFATQHSDLTVVANCWSGSSGSAPVCRPMWVFDFSGVQLCVLDGIGCILPVSGLWTDAVPGRFHQQFTHDFNLGTASPPPRSFSPAGVSGRITSIAVDPLRPRAVMVTEASGANPPRLWTVDLATGDASRMLDLTALPSAMAVGYDGTAWLGFPGMLQQVGLPRHGAADLRRTVSVAGTPSAIAAIEPEGRTPEGIVCRIPQGSRLGRILGSGPLETAPLPSAVVLGGIESMGSFRGGVRVAGTASSGIYTITFGGSFTPVLSETITAREIVRPRSLSVSRAGRILFTSDGVLRELARDSAGRWSVPAGSRWDGLRTGDLFTLQRGGQGASDWANTPSDRSLPEEPEGRGVADCPADFNHDGFLDFFDYDAFVHCFEGTLLEACPPYNPRETALDITGDGFVDFFDYDEFVAAFEAGC